MHSKKTKSLQHSQNHGPVVRWNQGNGRISRARSEIGGLGKKRCRNMTASEGRGKSIFHQG